MTTFFQTLVKETQTQQRQLFAEVPIQAALMGDVSQATYIAYLTEAYHHVKHTVPLLMAAGARFPMEKEFLRQALADYIEEEMGHQEWILSDISAAGGDADQVREGEPSMATEMMVSYAYDYISRINPVGLFGMIYVLEGTSTQMATQAAEAMQASLGLGDEAFRYLTSHGSLDIEHMAFFEALVNQIHDKKDQQAILHMAKRMFVLFAGVFASIPVLP